MFLGVFWSHPLEFDTDLYGVYQNKREVVYSNHEYRIISSHMIHHPEVGSWILPYATLIIEHLCDKIVSTFFYS